MSCQCGRVTNPAGEWVSGDCRLCWLESGGIPKTANRQATVAKSSRFALPDCIHLGEPTGDVGQCAGCGGQHRTEPLRVCDVHGVCTRDRAVKDIEGNKVACCRPGDCKERQTVADTADAQLVVTADGIGDHIRACGVAAGWKKANPGKPLTLVARKHIAPWVELLGGYDHLSFEKSPSLRHAWQANNTGTLHFIEAACKATWSELPPVHDLPAEATAWAEQYRGCVVLAPFSRGSGEGRNWLLSHWLVLEAELRQRGIDCVAIGATNERDRLKHFKGLQLTGESPSRIAALMKVATCVVANESGMAHLAGALLVPCVVLAAQLDGKAIHGLWPHTTVLQGPLSCSGCHWAGPSYRKACSTVCASLQAIEPADVLAAMEPYIGNRYSWMSDRLRVMLAKLNLILPAVAGKHQFVDRGVSFAKFLDFLAKKEGPVLMVETGCQRQADDPGAGMSTTIFGTYLADRNDGSRLISLDCDPEHVAIARSLPVCDFGTVEVIQTDSRPWLASFSGSPVDALYLDSCDCWVPGFQDVCMDEAVAALPLLTYDCPVLIDDSWREGDGFGGKGGKAIPWLASQGRRVVHSGYQTLLAPSRAVGQRVE